jgi:hypothetical protein
MKAVCLSVVVALSAVSLVAQGVDISVGDEFNMSVDMSGELDDEAGSSGGGTALKTIKAALNGDIIELGDGRSIALTYVKSQMPWPHIEFVEPVGAKVELYYGQNLAHSDEIPFLWKQAKIDQYVKMVVVEDEITWSVKFQGKKGFNLLVGSKGAAPKQAVSAAPQSKHFRLERTVFQQGDAINVSFFGMPGNSQDWLTAVPSGSSNEEWGSWQYTGGKKTGAFTLPELEPGTYELRAYYDYPAGGYLIQDRLTFTVK